MNLTPAGRPWAGGDTPGGVLAAAEHRTGQAPRFWDTSVQSGTARTVPARTGAGRGVAVI